MDTNELKQKAADLGDQAMKKAADLSEKAEELYNKPEVQNVVNKGKEALDKGKDWLENGKGKEYLDKGKAAVGDAKDKLEDFVEEKTDGKGIFGFGKK